MFKSKTKEQKSLRNQTKILPSFSYHKGRRLLEVESNVIIIHTANFSICLLAVLKFCFVFVQI